MPDQLRHKQFPGRRVTIPRVVSAGRRAVLHLLREIHEQPQVVDGLLSHYATPVDEIAAAIERYKPAFACIAARGTSDNAARYAQYLFGYMTGLPAMLALPSLHTLYERPLNLAGALVIGISQSGQAEDVRRVLEDARSQGALTLAITNYPDSPMATTAQYHLELHAGDERSIAATKTYTAQLFRIAQLVSALAPSSAPRSALKRVPDLMRDSLERSVTIEGWAQRYRYADRMAVIGRGFNYATAAEVSLKVKELAYIASEGWSEADFRHGPIAMVRGGYPVLLVAPDGDLLDNMQDLFEKVRQRDGECLVITNRQEIFEGAQQFMTLPGDLPEWLSPLVAILPGQVFAMHQALIRGYSPDTPSGLTKVTVTE